jgi:hypothetical protein
VVLSLVRLEVVFILDLLWLILIGIYYEFAVVWASFWDVGFLLGNY